MWNLKSVGIFFPPFLLPVPSLLRAYEFLRCGAQRIPWELCCLLPGHAAEIKTQMPLAGIFLAAPYKAAPGKTSTKNFPKNKPQSLNRLLRGTKVMSLHLQITVRTGKLSDKDIKYDQSYWQLQQRTTAAWTETLRSRSGQDLQKWCLAECRSAPTVHSSKLRAQGHQMSSKHLKTTVTALDAMLKVYEAPSEHRLSLPSS